MKNHRCRALLIELGMGVSVAGGAASCSSVEAIDTDSVMQAAKAYDIDIRRSLVVTEQQILERFTFERVMNQLVDDSSVPGLTAVQLFNSWWDTQNPRALPRPVDAVTHCDDPELEAAFNGFPYDCRPAPSEGYQSACDPFASGSPCAYIPIALFNRFDQAPEDGSHCGEYRIIFAKEGGVTNNRDRNLIIFEANMPNPLPNQGLKGCTKIVKTWAGLTDEANLELRADVLEEFYFYGKGNVPPVVALAHFGNNAQGLGQIRTNQFVEPETGWQLREFKLLQRCSGATCGLWFEPVTVKTNAFGGLFDPGSTLPGAEAFRAYFPTQVASLAAATVNSIAFDVPEQFNSGRSISSTSYDEMKYSVNLTAAASPLRSAIQTELTRLQSTLTVDHIVLRAQANTCAGCHRLNNQVDIGGGLTWPSAIGFVHVDERTTEMSTGTPRFVISEALNQVFLPHRKNIMDGFLNNKPRVPKGPKGPKASLNGHNSHG